MVKLRSFLGILIGIFLIMSVSATSTGKGIASETIIKGTVYYDGQPVDSGVKVSLDCGLINNERTKTTSDGTYYFDVLKKKCRNNDEVTVEAMKNGVSGFNTGKIDGSEKDILLNSGVEPPVVPEFGVIIGGMTILGAVGIFFFIRKK